MTRFDNAALSADRSEKKVTAAFKTEGAFPYEDIVNTPWPHGEERAEFREHMSLDDRAKIFAPFAALKGFYEALACYTEEHERNR